jgi:hypothetical protein
MAREGQGRARAFPRAPLRGALRVVVAGRGRERQRPRENSDLHPKIEAARAVMREGDA